MAGTGLDRWRLGSISSKRPTAGWQLRPGQRQLDPRDYGRFSALLARGSGEVVNSSRLSRPRGRPDFPIRSWTKRADGRGTLVRQAAGQRAGRPDPRLDWMTCIAGATIQQSLALIQNYENHKNIYKPEVIDSKLISRRGNDFKIYLRLLKKKILTVVLDTDHDVHYSRVDATRWRCRSYSTRIAEVEDAGKASERVLAPDTGYGFLWRL